MTRWLLVSAIHVALSGCASCFIDAIPDFSPEASVVFDCDPAIK